LVGIKIRNRKKEGDMVSHLEMTSNIMEGKKGLIMGVANDKSIAWGIAKTLAQHGAKQAFTYQGEAFEKRVRPLAESVGSSLLVSCDVTSEDNLDETFETIRQEWGGLDYVVHAIAYCDKEELKGRYADTSLNNFLNAMHISCYSFTSVARRAAALMNDGGSMVTLTYLGAERAMPNYNVMGVAKAALESSVRYLARDFGPDNIRVNGISAGPMRTLAGSAIGAARATFRYNQEASPLRRGVTLEEVGGAALYYLSDLSSGATGNIHYVDAGFHAVGMKEAE
jgi:enoyl-[acyl-carrier protein] reductase I